MMRALIGPERWDATSRLASFTYDRASASNPFSSTTMLRFRSFIALIAFFTIGIILFRSFLTRSSFYRSVSGHGLSLSEWLEEEEAQYSLFLKDRRQLIRRWGPLPVDVKP